MNQVPPVAFVGVCERANTVREGPPFLWKHNILGLKTAILSYIYPVDIGRLLVALAIYIPSNLVSARLKLVSSHGKEIGRAEVKLEGSNEIPEAFPNAYESLFPSELATGWEFFLVGMFPSGAIIKEPGIYFLVFEGEDEEIPLGRIVFAHASVPTLTEDRIAAIRSNPRAVKAVRFWLSCPKCKEKIIVYAGLDRKQELEQSGAKWYRELDDRFTCKCGHLDISLAYIRDNLHAYLGIPVEREADDLSFERLYEVSTLERILADFERLLDSNPREELMQRFIEDNPVLLQRFTPDRVFYKAPILTEHKTDIVVVTSSQELLLIELEKPSTPLVKKDGGMRAEAEKPLKQVRDWLNLVDHYRQAVLRGIQPDLKSEEITRIRAIVIVGRDVGNDETHLRKLKRFTDNEIKLLTYDDLRNDITALIKNLRAAE